MIACKEVPELVAKLQEKRGVVDVDEFLPGMELNLEE